MYALNDDLEVIKNTVYKELSYTITNVINEPEGTQYKACNFELNDKKIISRSSKVTPKKIGQFVTFWKRNHDGITEPYSEEDHFDFYIVNAKDENHFGQFVFPKSTLIKQGVVTSNKKYGKRGFRVYPIWDTPLNKQATQSQRWQLEYFYTIGDDKAFNKARKLYED